MAAYVDTLRLLAQPELRKSNGKDVRHQGDKKETYTQTGRRGGDGHQGGEDSRGRGETETGEVWDERGRQSDH